MESTGSNAFGKEYDYEVFLHSDRKKDENNTSLIFKA
jgi:hypothetical protein